MGIAFSSRNIYQAPCLSCKMLHCDFAVLAIMPLTEQISLIKMRQCFNPFIKTAASLSGTVLMMGGTAVFTELSLLNYFAINNEPTRITVGMLTFSSFSYVLVFSRGLSLWSNYSRPHPTLSLIHI